MQAREKYLEALQSRLHSTMLGQAPPPEVSRFLQGMGITSVDVVTLALAFVLGGFSSAVWTWRMALVGGRSPTVFEITSTVLLGGTIAFIFGCILRYWDVPILLTMVVSVLAGMGGDSIARLLLLLFNKVVINTFEKVFGFKVGKLDDDKK